MIPAIFVVLDELPLTPSGKINRLALPPPNIESSPAITYVAPRTTTEQHLAMLCARLLQLERVGIADNFFELGGHSLLATQLILRVQKYFGVRVSLRTFFEQPTIDALAEAVDTLLWAQQGSVSSEVSPDEWGEIEL
jgi:acyl carrier protein